ncbi:hypothetical protein Q3G72_030739 [Acer saccharum]|nr:hypothetical protein Q3G72_030739 [Acer saccharum]
MDLTRVKQHKDRDQDWSRLSTKRCKQHKDQVRDWSGLPGGVVGKISDNLSLYDYLCFSNVCKSWRSYQEETLHCNRSRGFPWLVMSKETETETITCISLLEKNKLCRLEMPNSSGGTLLGMHSRLVDHHKTCRRGAWQHNENKDVTHESVHTIRGISFDVWIPEAKDWCRWGFDVDVPGDYLTDLICFKGCFYLLTKEYNIRVLDAAYAYSTIQTQGYKKNIDAQFYEIKMSPDVPRECLILLYLVEFGDEILLVKRFLRKDDFEETYDFKVFRLDMCKKEWVKLDSLGDCVMFLGRNCSRCYSAKELWGDDDMGNCIYFTNGCGLRRGMHMEKEFSCSLEKDDWGIFRLNSEGGSEGFSYLAKQGKRPPVWLTAPLWWYFNKFRP